jgi:hypothetical protein
MCFQTMCPECLKITWGGCGAHVEEVLQGVPKDQLCHCNDNLLDEEPPPAPAEP